MRSESFQRPYKEQHNASNLTPADFRLPDSAGYRAGKDCNDLGADVDRVGPGYSNERWKKTSEYQQCLKDTEQNKSIEYSNKKRRVSSKG